MTRTPAQAIRNASRELDALVAEKVMSYERVSVWQGHEGCYLVRPGQRRVLVGWWLDDGRFIAHGMKPTVPAYSTDMAAAWEVVEKVAEWAADNFDLSRSGGDWIASFRLRDRGIDPYCDAEGRAQAATGPEAICHAALAVLQVCGARRGG